MYVIKNIKTGTYAKHTGETINNEGYRYVEYPWTLVNQIEEAQQYTTLEHANEVAFWELDTHVKWTLVNVETGQEYETKVGKYLPI